MARKPTEELKKRSRELGREAIERRRAEGPLYSVQLAEKSIFQAIGHPAFILDPEHRVLAANRASVKATGWPEEELRRKKCYEVFHRTGSPPEGCPMEKMLTSGHLETGEMEVEALGGIFLVSCTPVVDETGCLQRIIHIATDITEWKRTEEALRKSEQEKEAILNSMSEAVVYQDTEHRIVWANRVAGRSTGLTPEELVGRHCYEIWHQRSKPCPGCPVKKTYETGQPEKAEMTTPDGRVWVVRGYPVRDENDDIAGAVEVALEITERKRAEEEKKKLAAQLQQAHKMEAIGTLAGGIAHDFNNVLMGIQGNVSLMLVYIDSTHPHYERLKKIENQVQSAARLTSQLLGYARKGRYQVKPINLNQAVSEISNTFSRIRKDTTIYRELAENLFSIEADQGQIEQVLLNLLINAGDAMPGGGDLILKTMNTTHEDMKGKLYDPKPGNYVLLKVTDTGTGMDEKTVEHVFDPFFTTKEMGRGTGLGLASAYGIIKSHRGYIDVESQEGRGTTFTIYLPVLEKKVEKTVEAAKQIIEGSGTILFVDDEPMILDMGVKMLKCLGYSVLEAKGGRDAVEVYKGNKDKIDMVILDIIMPDMGGSEAYDRMKEINPDVKVLLSSGYSIDSQAKKILERGCDAFIQKPFTMKELSQCIRQIMGVNVDLEPHLFGEKRILAQSW